MNHVPHSRAHIRLTNQADVMSFIQQLTEVPDAFVMENRDGGRRIDAKSMLGVMYFAFDLQDEMYLVNETNNGSIPSFIDKFRVL